ncbi:P1 family peptidase [Cellulomonas sp. zg-ZUI199]|uniref:P1 family peptidase n=1 Tax=Cellulomonas wangleii TaxID=2816956 RepID=A0ABX8D3K2_9CELL|nr:P1 family peptidase [Cellulomonas wangleii]MBO0923627.1 P1 family peptidase [Cellulomonas wangleii]QVI61949.1 P1 family peptidase [Cellulomonas wangleii]
MSATTPRPQAPRGAGDAISDVPGVRVGHAHRTGGGWLTGVTVVLPPPGTVGGVDVRGGGPGTHETDALDPTTLVPTVDAVVLTGGSAFGLVSAHGAMRWCAERGRGFPVTPDPPGHVVPIVPAAAVFDLGRGGDFRALPTAEMGYEAAGAAFALGDHAPVARGCVGAGTGAAIAGAAYKGGVGTASVRLPDGPGGGVVVGALVVVNAAGAPTGLGPPAVPPGGALDPAAGRVGPGAGGAPASGAPLNTTLVVVATDAALDPAETTRTASAAHDGLARALDPVHTLADGDTVFALATQAVALPERRAERVAALVAVQAAAATVVERAVADAVRSATRTTTPAVDLPGWAG